MSIVCSWIALFLALTLFPTSASSSNPPTAESPAPQSGLKGKSPKRLQNSDAQAGAENYEDEEVPDEELTPAAVQLDVSKDSPLIQALYNATRETKEDKILARINEAKQLLEGADLKASDAQGRTALHWAVFGSSYNVRPRVLVAYEEIADRMIERGVEINREDIYHDTALDYLLYSPSFEMQTLLIENGATSGFLVSLSHFFEASLPDAQPEHISNSSLLRKMDLKPGATMSVRLDATVYSDRSRTGDPVTATVTYPLCKDGEQLACKNGELLVPPGTKITGTVLFAARAPDKYSRPRLVLDFSNILHKDGERSTLYARVLNVDNARETVQNNEILGIVQPHASKKASLALAALGGANPIVGYALKGVSTVYGLSLRREILFPAGTDIQIQIVRYSALKQKDAWPGWKRLPDDAELQQLAQSSPLRTATVNKVPSDPTNLIFLGSRSEVIAAFDQAGWIQADDLTLRSAFQTVQATMRQAGYRDAPVSTLLLNGRLPDLVFQKSLNTFAKRHHLRIWKLDKTYQGREVWIAAATHDIATSSSRASTKWSHRIDPHIDRERNWVETDLLFVGTATAYIDLDRPKAPRKLENATGDQILTDGKIAVVELKQSKAVDGQTLDVAPRP